MGGIKNWLDGAEQSVNDFVDDNVGGALDAVNGSLGAVEGALNDITGFLNRFNKNLPHYKNATAARENLEPVYLNQFDIVITPPAKINGNGYYVDMLIEQVKSVSGLPEISPTGTTEQKYMWATRTFSKPVPEKTTADLVIEFEINLSKRNSMYVYEMLRAWADLSFNYNSGFHGLKRQYAGEMTILVHNKVRRVFRQFNFNPVYMYDSMTQMELAYLSDEIYVLTAQFRADGWKEKRIPLNKAKLANA